MGDKSNKKIKLLFLLDLKISTEAQISNVKYKAINIPPNT